MPKNITTISLLGGGLEWINITGAAKKEIDYLRRKFKFNDLDLKDSYGNKYAQRPKFYSRGHYCFLILQFPVYRPPTKAIEPEEIDFFISRDFIITLHKNNLPPLVELFNLCQRDKFYLSQYPGNSLPSLLYEMISRLQEYCYPILDHLSLDIKNIEKNIFAGRERNMVTEILFIKRNILNFRKIMQAHKSVIQKIVKDSNGLIAGQANKAYFHNLIETTKDIWDILSEQKELIEALEDTNTSLVSFKLNDIMRTLTIFSVVVFPLTLLAAIFGMNTVNGMPFADSPHGFWLVIMIMLAGALCMFLFFKRKKWL